jgi:hypothetical protein
MSDMGSTGSADEELLSGAELLVTHVFRNAEQRNPVVTAELHHGVVQPGIAMRMTHPTLGELPGRIVAIEPLAAPGYSLTLSGVAVHKVTAGCRIRVVDRGVPWTSELTAATAVRCQGARHLVGYRNGRLCAPSHADFDLERTRAGGGVPVDGCFMMLFSGGYQRWLNHSFRAAIGNGHTDSAIELLRWGADPNSTNSAGDTPLHLAVRSGVGINAIHPLLEAGADPQATDSLGRSVLDTCVRYGTHYWLAGRRAALFLRNNDRDGPETRSLEPDLDARGMIKRKVPST